MKPEQSDWARGPFSLESPSGLQVRINANGSILRMDRGDITLNLFPGNEVEGGPLNLYLRRLGNRPAVTPLLGPLSPAAFRFDARGLFAGGEWEGMRFRLSLVLAESAPAWFWHLTLENLTDQPVEADLIYVQDVALAHYGLIRLNEYYVSQYIDHAPLKHAAIGTVLAARQNLSMGGRNPWMAIGALRGADAYATDALQIYGTGSFPQERLPAAIYAGLPGHRRQHEHAMAALQQRTMALEPKARAESGFFGWFEADHPAATSSADLSFVEQALNLPEAHWVARSAGQSGVPAAPTLFSHAPLMAGQPLAEQALRPLFPEAWRFEERSGDELLSFFTETNTHVVLAAKEARVLRPHGHILRSGSGLTPDETGLTSTVWMGGVFHSMVTQGHVSINRFTSTVHGYRGLFRSHGLRIFVEMQGRWHLLDQPSAFAMTPNACRWIYQTQDGTIEVVSTAGVDRHELGLEIGFRSGPARRVLLSLHLAVNGDDGLDALPVFHCRDNEGIVVRPIQGSELGRRFPEGSFRIDPQPGTVLGYFGGDDQLFEDQRSRNLPYLCVVTEAAAAAAFRISGRLIRPCGADLPSAREFGEVMTGGFRFQSPLPGDLAADVGRLAEIAPWFTHNALVHFLSPRGLEQYSGGGWGTRDVTQGPMELLLALGRFAPMRDLLLRVFANQNPDGDWPQWFMFFERERNIRAGDSHGDIVFWPLLALGQYLLATEDTAFLEESVPFFQEDRTGLGEREPVWVHVQRALMVIQGRMIPGTHLAAYGHGDWNDSLQPADPILRERLCSAWTVTLHYQTLRTLAAALHGVAWHERAAALDAAAARVREDFRRMLLMDGIVTGFLEFQSDGSVEYLLHPRDEKTGLSYSLLPMIHGIINDLFTAEQATAHLKLIETRLLGVDGARLFDRPLPYRGGPQTLFQRAESSSFFGREIGLMYTHAHLRYAEALARFGDAEGFFRALCQANPIGLESWVASAAPRQVNCYYSSSDAAFADRYEAADRYGEALQGTVPLEGGWRVYSSGAGISLSLIVRRFLGLERRRSALIVDPVIPKRLDGLTVEIDLDGRPLQVVYHIAEFGRGPLSLSLNGAELPFSRESNPYRPGAAAVPMSALRGSFKSSGNRLTVSLA